MGWTREASVSVVCKWTGAGGGWDRKRAVSREGRRVIVGGMCVTEWGTAGRTSRCGQ